MDDDGDGDGWMEGGAGGGDDDDDNDDDDDDDDNNNNNKVSAQIHFNICKETGVQLDKKHWYEHVPNSAVTNQGAKVTILWNQQAQTDRTIPQ